MDADIKFLSSCRCCLSDAGQLKDMTSEDLTSDTKFNLLDVFKQCSGVDFDEKLTTSICKSCEAKLHTSYEFREMCKASDIVLKQQVKEESISDTEMDGRMEVIFTDSLTPESPKVAEHDETIPDSKPVLDVKVEESVKVENDQKRKKKSEVSEHTKKRATTKKDLTPEIEGDRDSEEDDSTTRLEIGDKVRLEGNFSCDICDEVSSR
jgi:Zinc-finger associated domain (zf-AD)